MTLQFYLGTHRPHWLGQVDVPLFVSRRWLAPRKTLPRALGPWVLDSGGFTELNRAPHRWTLQPGKYVHEVLRYRDEIGGLQWVAPMDWMVEPSVLRKTGLTVAEHQRRTIASFQLLRACLGPLVVPVLQGWEPDQYERHLDAYADAGVDLLAEPVVAVGSICRRGQDAEVRTVVRRLAQSGLRLHAFGVRNQAALDLSDVLVSADSMAWSYRARRSAPLPGCRHRTCANCQRFALAWRARIVESLGQLRIEEASCA